MPHTYFPPSGGFVLSQQKRPVCSVNPRLASHPLAPSTAPSSPPPPPHLSPPETPSLCCQSLRPEWAGLDHVLIIEIFGPSSEAKAGRCFPQVKGTDSSWALLRQEGAWEVFRTQEPVASKRLSAQPRRMPVALDQGKGRDSSPTDPPNPAFVTVPSFPPHAPPGITPGSQNLPRGRKSSDVHFVGILYIHKNGLQIPGELLRHGQPCCTLRTQKPDIGLGQSPSLCMRHSGLL